ncbi:hypothetical protein KP509_20G085600 [Ceratopteris richardii]|uniref:Uncharacterized protein n=1 Tax=Ceratopteris richardii TaxID=49495 RepID=A0A8T2SKZ1_CERRI|nr:hypothetical protein KP509_20G085600 [Ceratopteris richardii]
MLQSASMYRSLEEFSFFFNWMDDSCIFCSSSANPYTKSKPTSHSFLLGIRVETLIHLLRPIRTFHLPIVRDHFVLHCSLHLRVSIALLCLVNMFYINNG